MKKKGDRYDMVGAIMDFESGGLGGDGVLKLFQYLVDSNLAWSLQGYYGRMAKALLDHGLIKPTGASR